MTDEPDLFLARDGGNFNTTFGALIKIDDSAAFPDQGDAGNLETLAGGIQPMVEAETYIGGTTTAGATATSSFRLGRRETIRLYTCEPGGGLYDGFRFRIYLASDNGAKLTATNSTAGIEILEIFAVPGREPGVVSAYRAGRIQSMPNKFVTFDGERAVLGFDVSGDGTHDGSYRVGDTVLLSPSADTPDRKICTVAGTTTTATLVDGPNLTPALPLATTTELEDVGDAVNTTNKTEGAIRFNTTTNMPVYASGSTAGSVWVDAQGATEHTPV